MSGCAGPYRAFAMTSSWRSGGKFCCPWQWPTLFIRRWLWRSEHKAVLSIQYPVLIRVLLGTDLQMFHLNLFLFFGAICVAGAVNLLVQSHPINSALSLIAVMASLAAEYLLLGAEFVAAVQVIVYAGAIMVLFVITIMLLNAGKEERSKGSRVAILLGVPGVLIGGVLVA